MFASATDNRAMMFAKPIATGNFEDLTVEQASQFLKGPFQPSCVPPVKPKSGEIYLYSPESLSKLGMLCLTLCYIVSMCIAINECINLKLLDDWRCDQYRWFQNGRKKLPKKDPCILHPGR